MHAGRPQAAAPTGSPGRVPFNSGARAYWAVAVRRRWVIVVGFVATVASAMAMVSLHEPVYRAETEVLVAPPAGDVASGPRTNIPNEIQILQSALVQDRVRTLLGIDGPVPPVEGSSVDQTSVISLRVSSGDATTAKVLADAYVTAFREVKREENARGMLESAPEFQRRIDELQTQIDELDAQVQAAPAAQRKALESALSAQRSSLVGQQTVYRQRLDQAQFNASLYTPVVRVVSPAVVPTSPIEPTPLRTAAVAAVVGLMLGVGAAFLLDVLDDSIRDPEHFERVSGGTPVMTVVPVRPGSDHRPVALVKPDDPVAEAFRGLRTNLQFLSLDRRCRVLLVTSALPGEGKSTVSSNLAVVLAQAGNRVVLVDADLRRPSLQQVFGVDGSRGIVDALLDAPIEQLLRHVPLPGGGELRVLPAGRAPANQGELLGGARMRTLLGTLAEAFDVVIVDSAPVLPVADSVALTASVDGVVLVTQAHRTSERQVRDVVDTLGRVNAPVLGAVLNRFDAKRTGGYGYGYGYGYNGYGGYGRRTAEGAVKGRNRGKGADTSA